MPLYRRNTKPEKLPELELPPLQFVDDAATLHTVVHRLRQKPIWESRTIDTETTGARLWVDRLKVVQIGVKDLPVYVLQIERIPESEWEPLREYLAEPRPNVLQNAKFDLNMLAAAELPLAGSVRDTLLRNRLFHLGNRVVKHSLKDLLERWCDRTLNKQEQTKFVGDTSRERLSEDKINYAARDISATTKVDHELTVGLESRTRKRPGMLQHVAREEQFLHLLAALELQGVYLDQLALDQLTKTIKQAMELLETALAPTLRPNLQQLKLAFGKKPTFSPTRLSPTEVQAAFGVPDDATKTLLKAALKQPAAKLVLQHRTLWRQLDLCQALVQSVNPTTGKLHPDHVQVERLQGTLGPSRLKIELLERLAQSTHHEPLCLLEPAPGHTFIKLSFPELELRLLAFYTQEPQLQVELDSGKSPIAHLADVIAESGLAVEPYTDHSLATALWHGTGILNQKGAYLQTWCLSEYGLVLDLKQVKALQALIPVRYPKLQPFHEQVGKSDYEQSATLLGALRLWEQETPKNVRQFLIWSSVDEILKLLGVTVKPCCDKTGGRVAFLGKQSLLLECPTEQSEALTTAIHTELSKRLSQTCPQVAIAFATEKICERSQKTFGSN